MLVCVCVCVRASQQIILTYPNKMEYSILSGRGQTQLDAQLFKISGNSLQDMRSVDHMTHMSINSHAANTSFNEVVRALPRACACLPRSPRLPCLPSSPATCTTS